MARITPRKKPAPGLPKVYEGLSEAFAAAFIPRSPTARKAQRREEYREAREYFEGNHRRMKGKL